MPVSTNEPSAMQHGGSIRNHNGYYLGKNGTQGGRSGAVSSRKRSTDRTTRLLVAILILFLITEFPQVRPTQSLSEASK